MSFRTASVIEYWKKILKMKAKLLQKMFIMVILFSTKLLLFSVLFEFSEWGVWTQNL